MEGKWESEEEELSGEERRRGERRFKGDKRGEEMK